MSFTFGQLFLQGLATGTQQRQNREELQFRRETQDFINNLNRDRFNEQVKQFEITQGHAEEQAGVQNAFQAQRLAQQSVGLGIQQQNANLARDQFNLAEQTHIDLPTPFGTGKITVADYLRDLRAKQDLSFRQQPVTFQPGDVEALQAAMLGDVSQLGGRSFSNKLAPTVNAVVGASVDPVATRQRGAAIDFFETQDAIRGIQEQAAAVDPIDPANIQTPRGPREIFRDFTRAAFGESAEETSARLAENEARGATTLDEALKATDSQLNLIQSIQNLPIHQQGPAAASVANRMSAFASDASKVISGSTLSETQKREFNRTFTRIARFHLQHAPRGDAGAAALNGILNKAIEDEDTEAILEAVKAIGTYMGVENRTRETQSRLAQREFQQLTGQ